MSIEVEWPPRVLNNTERYVWTRNEEPTGKVTRLHKGRVTDDDDSPTETVQRWHGQHVAFGTSRSFSLERPDPGQAISIHGFHLNDRFRISISLTVSSQML